MRILAIETSCDETGVAFLEISEKGERAEVRVLGNALLSQTSIHSLLGGVVPSLAKREHQNNLVPMLRLALQESDNLTPQDPDYKEINAEKIKKLEKEFELIFIHEFDLKDILLEFLLTVKAPKIDLITVTSGPGLEPALWVGINFAKALSVAWKIPIIPANHMEGHILSSLLVEKNKNTLIFTKPEFPLLSLLISGGHTELVLSNTFGSYEIIGKTRDDAIGEAFDKVARMLGLPYPGGPGISKLAESARAEKIESEFDLPRPMMHTDNLDFSFSGLKTSVLYTLKKIPVITENIRVQIALEFEDAVTDVLIAKTREALSQTGAKTFAVGGGVIANTHIRKALSELCENEFPHVSLHLPHMSLTTDNAVMIGITGYFTSKVKREAKDIKAEGNLRLT